MGYPEFRWIKLDISPFSHSFPYNVAITGGIPHFQPPSLPVKTCENSSLQGLSSWVSLGVGSNLLAEKNLGGYGGVSWPNLKSTGALNLSQISTID